MRILTLLSGSKFVVCLKECPPCIAIFPKADPCLPIGETLKNINVRPHHGICGTSPPNLEPLSAIKPGFLLVRLLDTNYRKEEDFYKSHWKVSKLPSGVGPTRTASSGTKLCLGNNINNNLTEGKSMFSKLDRFTDHTYASLRIVAGFLFIFHGTQKLLGFPSAAPEGIPPFIIYIAGPIELVGGALIMLGLFTRQAAFLCSGLMAAAYFMAHATQALYPILNQGELAIMFCFSFLYIACTGSGIWSIDKMLAARSKTSIGAPSVEESETEVDKA